MDRGGRSVHRPQPFERSTSAIASIDNVDPSIDQCHCEDRHSRSVHRPVSLRGSTPAIRTIDQCHRVDRHSRSNDRPQSFERSTPSWNASSGIWTAVAQATALIAEAQPRLRSRLRLDSPGSGGIAAAVRKTTRSDQRESVPLSRTRRPANRNPAIVRRVTARAWGHWRLTDHGLRLTSSPRASSREGPAGGRYPAQTPATHSDPRRRASRRSPRSASAR